VSREMVRTWRSRFQEARLGGLTDVPRAGAPRKITDEQVEVLVTRTLTEKGRGQDTHWPARSMAAEAGLSQSSVSRIWRAFGLKPHLGRDMEAVHGPGVHCEGPRRRRALHVPAGTRAGPGGG
jgi:transposase